MRPASPPVSPTCSAEFLQGLGLCTGSDHIFPPEYAGHSLRPGGSTALTIADIPANCILDPSIIVY